MSGSPSSERFSYVAEQLHAAQLRQRRHPVAGMDDLVAHLAFGQMAGPRDDAGQPDPALEQAELRAAVRPRAAAAEVRPLLGRVAVVGLEGHDGPLAQAEFVQLLQQRGDPFVARREEGGVEVPRIRQVLVALQPLHVALVRIVRHVQGEVDERTAAGGSAP